MPERCRSSGDDLRDFHPDYAQLLHEDARAAASATDADSGRWIAKAVTYAREHSCFTIIEGIMRRPLVPIETAAVFRRAGYRVEA